MTMRMPTDCTVRYSDVCVVLYRYCRATWAGGNSFLWPVPQYRYRSYIWHRQVLHLAQRFGGAKSKTSGLRFGT